MQIFNRDCLMFQMWRKQWCGICLKHWLLWALLCGILLWNFLFNCQKCLHPVINLLWCTSYSKCIKVESKLFWLAGLYSAGKEDSWTYFADKTWKKVQDRKWELGKPTQKVHNNVPTQTVLVELFLRQPHYFHLQQHFKPDIFRKLEVVLTSILKRRMDIACFEPQDHFSVSIFSKNTHWQ